MRYTYNGENRLIRAQPETPTAGSTRVEFVYDYMGRRVQKTVYSYSSGSWILASEFLFLYDRWNMLKETTIPAGGSSVDKYYVWGLDLSQSLQGAGGVGGLLTVVDGSLTYQYLYDANGNVGQLVDASGGAIAAHYEYDPFGNIVSQTGAYVGENAYRFSTKVCDVETNIYNYGYRYYAPELGRWLNRDPIDEIGGLNLYAYAQNSPIDAFDAYGQTAQKDGEILIEIRRTNLGRHATIGLIVVSSKGFDQLDGISMELKRGYYDIGNGSKNYPIATGTYKAEPRKGKYHGYFAIRLEDKAPFDNILIHVGRFPWNSQGCILVGMTYKRNTFFNKKNLRSLSLTEWEMYKDAGMITEVAHKYPATTKLPHKRSMKTMTTDLQGYTDVVSNSRKWLKMLERYYEKVKKKHGDCTSISVEIK